MSLFRASPADDAAGFGLANADHVEDRTVGGADEGAGTALDAVHNAVLFGVVPTFQLGEGLQHVRLQSHRAGAHALAATQTRMHLAAHTLFFVHEEQARHTLGGVGAQIGDGLAHHRTTGNDLASVLRNAH